MSDNSERVQEVINQYGERHIPPLRLSWLPYPADSRYGDAKHYMFNNSPCAKIADELKSKHWNDSSLKVELTKCVRENKSIFEARIHEIAQVTKRML